MDIKKILLPIAGIGGAILTGVLLKKKPSETVKVATTVVPEPKELFAGVPLSKLNELAKEVYHGIKCTVDQWGFLVFHCKSKRGHQTFHTQMSLNHDGKLISLGGHYPGEWWSSADEFAKRANELFTFKK